MSPDTSEKINGWHHKYVLYFNTYLAVSWKYDISHCYSILLFLFSSLHPCTSLEKWSLLGLMVFIFFHFLSLIVFNSNVVAVATLPMKCNANNNGYVTTFVTNIRILCHPLSHLLYHPCPKQMQFVWPFCQSGHQTDSYRISCNFGSLGLLHI